MFYASNMLLLHCTRQSCFGKDEEYANMGFKYDSISYFHNAVRIVYNQLQIQQTIVQKSLFQIVVLNSQQQMMRQILLNSIRYQQTITRLSCLATKINALKLGKSPSSDGFPNHYYFKKIDVYLPISQYFQVLQENYHVFLKKSTSMINMEYF